MNRSSALLHRVQDPQKSRDPRIRAVVERLAQVDYAPAPRPEFRAELRQQLVAIAARVVDEAATEAATAGTGETGTRSKAKRALADGDRPSRFFGKPLGIATACVAVLALGFGGVVWKSESALPGDSLYGLKRTSESVRLSLTSGDTDRGHQYLSLATTRVREARDLLGQDSALGAGSGVLAAGVSPHTLSLIRGALRSSNTDVRSGWSLFHTQALESQSASPWSIMTAWAPGQQHRLWHLANAVGDGPTRTAALQSWNLVHAALLRAQNLAYAAAHPCTAHPDPFGPKPCSAVTGAAPGTNTTSVPAPGTSSTSAPTPSGSGSPAPRHGSGTNSPATDGSSTTQRQHPGGATTTAGPTKPTSPTLPPLPLGSRVHHPATTAPSLPISVDTCGLTATIGPIGVQIGLCPTGH